MSEKNNSEFIDIREVFRHFVEKWRQIGKITFLFILIGFVFAFGTTPEFSTTSKVILKSESSSSSPSLGGLSSLAGLAGINLGGGNVDGISPEMYTEVVNSFPFIIDLVGHELNFKSKNLTKSSLIYFKEYHDLSIVDFLVKFTVKLPYQIANLFKADREEKEITFENGIYSFSMGDFEILDNFRGRINIEINPESGSIILNTKMPDAYATAQLNSICLEKLQKYIVDFHVKKAKEELEFLTLRYEEAEKEYQTKKNILAGFIDRNQNITSERIRFEQEELRNQYELSFSILKGLSTQLEQAKMTVKEAAPVFTIVNPPSIPVEKSEPKRGSLIILFTFTGFLGALIYLFIKEFYI
ncbi:MAG: hypothetical protein ABJH98_16185 [Reichenbachiella sp.]|uniref:hypothetical protein n=1 Tax=Reichenbachiella sp. TaxID=2184521 RepID=UPI00329947C3